MLNENERQKYTCLSHNGLQKNYLAYERQSFTKTERTGSLNLVNFANKFTTC